MLTSGLCDGQQSGAIRSLAGRAIPVSSSESLDCVQSCRQRRRTAERLQFEQEVHVYVIDSHGGRNMANHRSDSAWKILFSATTAPCIHYI
jgi:hypothetical protein